MAELNSNLVAIIKMISMYINAQIKLEEHCKNDTEFTYNDLLNHCMELMYELQDDNSVYHIIPKDEAINIIVDDIYTYWSKLTYLPDNTKQLIKSSIQFNLINFFGETTGTVLTPPDEGGNNENTDPVDPPTGDNKDPEIPSVDPPKKDDEENKDSEGENPSGNEGTTPDNNQETT